MTSDRAQGAPEPSGDSPRTDAADLNQRREAIVEAAAKLAKQLRAGIKLRLPNEDTKGVQGALYSAWASFAAHFAANDFDKTGEFAEESAAAPDAFDSIEDLAGHLLRVALRHQRRADYHGGRLGEQAARGAGRDDFDPPISSAPARDPHPGELVAIREQNDRLCRLTAKELERFGADTVEGQIIRAYLAQLDQGQKPHQGGIATAVGCRAAKVGLVLQAFLDTIRIGLAAPGA